MQNIKLLFSTLLISSLLSACGMSGPLYRAAPAEPQSSTAPAAQNDDSIAPEMEKNENENDVSRDSTELNN